MNTILDHVADSNGAELARLSKLHQFPDFVKTASVQETVRPGQLPGSVYGDPRIEAFPCHTPASTYLSALFFEEKKAEYDPKNQKWVRERIDQAVNYFGIKTAVDTMREEWEGQHKQADTNLPDSDFAMVWVDDDGTKNRHLRMCNAMETKTAAAWLHQHRDSMRFSDRHVIAKKIMQKTAQYGVGLGEHRDFVEKQAGRGVCNPKAVAGMIRQREKLASGDFRTQVGKLASIVEGQPSEALHPDNLVKLAETVDNIDHELKLVGKYTNVLRRPEEVLFETTFSKAAEAMSDACSLTTGKAYDRSDFTKLALSDIQAAFGPELAKEVQAGLGVDPEKLAAVASTLPRPDAELFDSLAAEAGIKPIPIKGASYSGASHEKLASFASSY